VERLFRRPVPFGTNCSLRVSGRHSDTAANTGTDACAANTGTYAGMWHLQYE
jgi:hypothetical protein